MSSVACLINLLLLRLFNIGICAEILGTSDESISKKVSDYKNSLNTDVLQKVEKMKSEGWENKFD